MKLKSTMNLRLATSNDIASIARLHARSWQENYCEALTENYLNNQVIDDRLSVWTTRLSRVPENQYVLIAESGGDLYGFVCAYGMKHKEYGTIIDNLHVNAEYKGKGLGKTLLISAASWAAKRYRGEGLYLEVLECNLNAIGFYEALGAKKRGSAYWHTPCGNKVKEFVYYWATAEELVV